MAAYESSWNLPLYSEAVSLDGEYIENNVDGYHTINVSGRESLEYDIDEEDRPTGMDGMEYYGKRQGGRTLTVRFALSAPSAQEFMARYRKLKKFCRGEDRLIRFKDEPNAHYTGMLKSIEEPDEGSTQVISEMQFYCPDPYLVSDVITTVTAVSEDGKLVAHIDNDSSGDVYPVYRIKHKAENGYIGIVHEGGAFEMGNIEEADQTPYQQSERLITDLSDFAAYTGNNPQNPNITQNGTLTLGSDGWLSANDLGSGSYWHGGCRRIKMPQDSEGNVGAKNFYCWWESKFETGLMGQTGFQQVLLSDENDQFIGGFGIIKPDMTGNTANVVFWVPGYGEYKNIAFTPSNQDAQNAYHQRGYEDILKEGSKLRFYYYGTYYTVDVPSLAEKKVTYIYIVIGNLGTSPKYITVNKIGRFFAIKNNVDKLKDVPNRYPEGSEVVISCEDDSVEINGLPRNDELVTGSAFYSLPPGETDVEFYTSSWCDETPEITVEYRKRWL